MPTAFSSDIGLSGSFCIYYILASAIGFGALVVIFDPEGFTLEEYDNLPRDVDLNDIGHLTIPLERICPVVPSYTTVDIIQEIISGKRPLPTISTGVGLASVLAAHEAINIILQRREIAKAPRYTYIDLLDRKFIVGVIS